MNHPSPVFAKASRALQFDGIDDAVVVPDDPELNVAASDFTFRAWVRTIEISGVTVLLDGRSGAEDPFVGDRLFYVDAYLGFQMSDEATYQNYPWGWIANAAWHHVATVVERASRSRGVRLYVDGGRGPIRPAAYGKAREHQSPCASHAAPMVPVRPAQQALGFSRVSWMESSCSDDFSPRRKSMSFYPSRGGGEVSVELHAHTDQYGNVRTHVHTVAHRGCFGRTQSNANPYTPYFHGDTNDSTSPVRYRHASARKPNTIPDANEHGHERAKADTHHNTYQLATTDDFRIGTTRTNP